MPLLRLAKIRLKHKGKIMVYQSELASTIRSTYIGSLFLAGYELAIAANMSPEGCFGVALIFAGLSYFLLGRLFVYAARMFEKERALSGPQKNIETSKSERMIENKMIEVENVVTSSSKE
jgi:hypothetical protein